MSCLLNASWIMNIHHVCADCLEPVVPSVVQVSVATTSWWRPSHTYSTSIVSGAPCVVVSSSLVMSLHYVKMVSCSVRTTTRLPTSPVTVTPQLSMTSSFRVPPETTTIIMTSTQKRVSVKPCSQRLSHLFHLIWTEVNWKIDEMKSDKMTYYS